MGAVTQVLVSSTRLHLLVALSDLVRLWSLTLENTDFCASMKSWGCTSFWSSPCLPRRPPQRHLLPRGDWSEGIPLTLALGGPTQGREVHGKEDAILPSLSSSLMESLPSKSYGKVER